MFKKISAFLTWLLVTVTTTAYALILPITSIDRQIALGEPSDIQIAHGTTLGEAFLWDADTGELLRSFQAHFGVTSAAVNEPSGLADDPLPTGILHSLIAVEGAFEITGTAGGDNYQSYQLLVGAGTEPDSFTLLAEGTEAFENTLIITVPVFDLPAGEFTIMLKVFAQNGMEVTDTLASTCSDQLCGRGEPLPNATLISLTDTGDAFTVTATVGGPTYAVYKLLIGEGSNPDNFNLFQEGTVSYDNEPLTSIPYHLLPPENFTIKLEVSATDGLKVTDTLSELCTDVACGRGEPLPNVNLESIADTGESFTIFGTAGGPSYASYKLFIGEGSNPDSFILFQEGTESYENEPLTSIPYHLLPSGNFTIKLEVSATDELKVTDTLSELCTDVVCGRGEPLPNVNLESIAGSGASFTIFGTAGGPTYASYKLFIGEGSNPDSFILIQEGTESYDNETLTSIPYHLLPSGNFTIKLEVSATDGLMVTDTLSELCQDAACGRGEPLPNVILESIADTGEGFTIFGTAGGSTFSSYDLYIGLGSTPSSFNRFAQGSVEKDNEVLAEIAYPQLPSGEFSVFLEVTATDGLTVGDQLTHLCNQPSCGHSYIPSPTDQSPTILLGPVAAVLTSELTIEPVAWGWDYRLEVSNDLEDWQIVETYTSQPGEAFYTFDLPETSSPPIFYRVVIIQQ